MHIHRGFGVNPEHSLTPETPLWMKNFQFASLLKAGSERRTFVCFFSPFFSTAKGLKKANRLSTTRKQSVSGLSCDLAEKEPLTLFVTILQ